MMVLDGSYQIKKKKIKKIKISLIKNKENYGSHFSNAKFFHCKENFYIYFMIEKFY